MPESIYACLSVKLHGWFSTIQQACSETMYYFFNTTQYNTPPHDSTYLRASPALRPLPLRKESLESLRNGRVR